MGIRLISASTGVGVEVGAELGKIKTCYEIYTSKASQKIWISKNSVTKINAGHLFSKNNLIKIGNIKKNNFFLHNFWSGEPILKI